LPPLRLADAAVERLLRQAVLAGWLVLIRAIGSKATGWSTWTVVGSKVVPNAAAKTIAFGYG
jgi:hypothetical protein